MASRSARLGDVPVAANAILLHFFDVAAFLTDGFAYTAEAFVGQSIGARNLARYRQAIRLSTIWGMGFGVLAGLIIWVAGEPLVRLMTTSEPVVQFALQHLGWAALCVFFVARGLSFASRLPAIERRAFDRYEKAAVKI